MAHAGHEAHTHGQVEHGHDHGHGQHDHGHTHGVIDASITTSRRGLWAVKWSFAGLFVTALLQVIVVILSGSVALLADTIHNFGDAATAVPLGVAFLFARRRPTRRFTYGYGRRKRETEKRARLVLTSARFNFCVSYKTKIR